MGLYVNTNIDALTAYRNLNNTQSALSKSLQKLSSGLRINTAADDAAGLAISEGLKSQVSGLGVAQRNAQDGISLIQTAEGSLTEVHTILHRLRDLAVQAGNGTNNTQSLAAITSEATDLVSELTRIGDGTNFNGIQLLDGSNTALTFQIGADSDATTSQISVDLTSANVTAVATAVSTLVYAPGADAAATIAALDTQIDTVSGARADLGALQNRFESASRSLAVTQQNLTAAQSRITDTDMASEMVSYTRSSILSQAGTAMLAQANQSSQAVLKLLQ